MVLHQVSGSLWHGVHSSLCSRCFSASLLGWDSCLHLSRLVRISVANYKEQPQGNGVQGCGPTHGVFWPIPWDYWVLDFRDFLGCILCSTSYRLQDFRDFSVPWYRRGSRRGLRAPPCLWSHVLGSGHHTVTQEWAVMTVPHGQWGGGHPQLRVALGPAPILRAK